MDRIEEPQNERSRRTRAAALDAAWELLEERGPEHVTMGRVASRAGITRRGLYLHFSSRSELLVELHTRIDELLDLDASVQPVFEAADAITALDEFVAHLARYHPRIRLIDTAFIRAAEDDPEVAHLAERGVAIWHDACRYIAGRLADEGRLAPPWTVETAADLMWTFMFPEPLGRLTVERGWSNERYGELLGVLFRRALVADAPTR